MPPYRIAAAPPSPPRRHTRCVYLQRRGTRIRFLPRVGSRCFWFRIHQTAWTGLAFSGAGHYRMRSDYDQGLFSCPSGGCQRYGLVERDQSSTMRDSKCQKVDVRQFPGTQQFPAVHHCIVEQANVVRDK